MSVVEQCESEMRHTLDNNSSLGASIEKCKVTDSVSPHAIADNTNATQINGSPENTDGKVDLTAAKKKSANGRSNGTKKIETEKSLENETKIDTHAKEEEEEESTEVVRPKKRRRTASTRQLPPPAPPRPEKSLVRRHARRIVEDDVSVHFTRIHKPPQKAHAFIDKEIKGTF
jgi:hypothetical protein